MTTPLRHPLSPADLFGDLLVQVQGRRLFADGKTFVDAVPLRPVAEILDAFAQHPRDDAALRAFVLDNFRLPAAAQVHAAHGELDLRRYIRSLWPELIRSGGEEEAAGSRLAVRGAYVVPGGRFDELYYWDTYFSMLGLVRDYHERLARDMVDSFTDLIARYGHIPNGTRTYFLSRSHPPLLFAMIDLLPDDTAEARRRRLAALLAEHRFWMEGSDDLQPGERHAHVVAMPDGARLNRYWDAAATPREESFFEDYATAARSGRDSAAVFRDLRAGAESGWDFSSRWFDASAALPGIRVTEIVPTDLNAFLFGLEQTAARLAHQLDDQQVERSMTEAAVRRQAALTRWCWSDEGYFADYDLRDDRTGALTAATFAPLFTGAASIEQAGRVAATAADHLLATGGLRTTLVETGEQWDWPNGWAPLQWIAVAGLRRYGHHALAAEIGRRWVATVDAEFQRSGCLFEKYDVEHGRSGGGGEYPAQLGFGWTNGVTAALIDEASN